MAAAQQARSTSCRRTPAAPSASLQNYDFVDPGGQAEVPGAAGSLRAADDADRSSRACSRRSEHDARGPGAHARDDAGPQPHAAREGRRRASPTSTRSRTSGASTSRASRTSTSSSSRWRARWPPMQSLHAEPVARTSAQQLDEMMRALMLQDERLRSAAAPARHEPRASSSPHRRDGAALSVPRRRGRLAPGSHAADGRAAASWTSSSASSRACRATWTTCEQVDRERGRAAAGRGGGRGPRAAAGADQEARGAGYLERKGDELELTARAIRKIADKALRDVFAGSSATASAATPSSAAAPAATRPTRPSPTSSATRSCSTSSETLMNARRAAGPGHAGPARAGRLRGLPHRAAHPGGHRASCST